MLSNIREVFKVIYFISKDGRVPSKEFIQEAGMKMGSNINFQYHRGSSLNTASTLLSELKGKRLDEWELFYINPTGDIDNRVDAYMTNDIETKEAIIQRLESKKDSKKLTGELLADLFL